MYIYIYIYIYTYMYIYIFRHETHDGWSYYTSATNKSAIVLSLWHAKLFNSVGHAVAIASGYVGLPLTRLQRPLHTRSRSYFCK